MDFMPSRTVGVTPSCVVDMGSLEVSADAAQT